MKGFVEKYTFAGLFILLLFCAELSLAAICFVTFICCGLYVLDKDDTDLRWPKAGLRFLIDLLLRVLTV